VSIPEPTAAEVHDVDLQAAVDDELGRLPDDYRGVVVLCDLEGLTRREAARYLGIPEGSVASRLARARAMLARRLARERTDTTNPTATCTPAIVSGLGFLRAGTAAAALGPADLSAAERDDTPPDVLIGYTEFRTDLPGGRHANVRTRRAVTASRPLCIAAPQYRAKASHAAPVASVRSVTGTPTRQ
jgi:hypothetical protein